MDSAAIQKIGQISVPVRNLDLAVQFYREKLGLPLLFQTGNLAFFDCGATRLLLNIPESEQFSQSSSVLYFHVADIRKSYEALLAKGVTFIDEPHAVGKMGNTESWMVFFEDPDQNIHALMSEMET